MGFPGFHVSQGCVQTDEVVLVDELYHQLLRGQQVVPVVAVAVLPHHAVESLGDTVGLLMPRSGADVQQVMHFDTARRSVLQSSLPGSCTMRGLAFAHAETAASSSMATARLDSSVSSR